MNIDVKQLIGKAESDDKIRLLFGCTSLDTWGTVKLLFGFDDQAGDVPPAAVLPAVAAPPAGAGGSDVPQAALPPAAAAPPTGAPDVPGAVATTTVAAPQTAAPASQVAVPLSADPQTGATPQVAAPAGNANPQAPQGDALPQQGQGAGQGDTQAVG
jgi:hypothetical protein